MNVNKGLSKIMPFKYFIYSLLCNFLLIIPHLSSQTVNINELMAINESSHPDEDGDFNGWIELYNESDSQIDLRGYTLSSSKTLPAKWTIQKGLINPKGFLVIFNSGKDRNEQISHWEAVVSRGDDWKYSLGSENITHNWIDAGYDDSDWQTGESGFGYGDDDDATVVENTISLYIRKIFDVEDISQIICGVLHVGF